MPRSSLEVRATAALYCPLYYKLKLVCESAQAVYLGIELINKCIAPDLTML